MIRTCLFNAYELNISLSLVRRYPYPMRTASGFTNTRYAPRISRTPLLSFEVGGLPMHTISVRDGCVSTRVSLAVHSSARLSAIRVCTPSRTEAD